MSKFGRYRVNEHGEVVREDFCSDGPRVVEGPRIVDPGEEVARPVIGPTRVGEWLMVDVRVSKAVPRASRLYEVCQALCERGACGVVENTLVIDLLEASARDRAFLLRKSSWPVV